MLMVVLLPRLRFEVNMNPFERHKIKHLSPSSLNLFANEPALWVVQYLLGRRFGVGCAAHRGTASEEGVQAGLIDHAKPIKELRQYGKLTGYQGKVVHRFDDIPVDVLGFYDFEFGEAGVIVDLKSSLKLASAINPEHGRQVSHYIHARNLEGRVCYATPAKLAVYRVEDPAMRREEMNNVARRVQKFLSISTDPMELASILTPRVDEFWWSDPSARAAAKEVYGL